MLRDNWFLGENGEAALDSPYVEFNAPLIARAAPAALAADCLRAAYRSALGGGRRWRPRRIVLSGIDAACLEAARQAGPLSVRQTMAAPFVDLIGQRQKGRDYLDTLSANARYQLRRSDRAYAAAGALTLRRVESLAEAHAMLDELAVLHQATWESRGQPGAFAVAFFRRFHHALIERGLARGEIDLLRVCAGDSRVGILYNFRHRGRALAYQSGFDYGAAARHHKPGLTCHHAAIRFCSDLSLDCYDFLAGDDRYKRSLSDGETSLHWAELGWAGSLRDRSRALASGPELRRVSQWAGQVFPSPPGRRVVAESRNFTLGVNCR